MTILQTSFALSKLIVELICGNSLQMYRHVDLNPIHTALSIGKENAGITV